MQVERGIADGVDRGDDDGEVLGAAAGHYRVDGDLFDGGATVVGRDLRDQLAAVAPRHLDSPAHPCPRGRDDGKAIAHAVIEKLVEIGVSGRHGRRLAQLTQGRAWCSAFPTAWRGSGGTGSGRSGTGTYR